MAHNFEMSIAKNWCYTLNNPTDDELKRFSCLPSFATYHVFGHEVGEAGTPHLQGLILLDKKKRLSFLRKWCERGHYEVCRNLPASVQYCKKGGDFKEFGKLSVAGRRTDLEGFKESVRSGTYDLATIREMHSEVYAKYPRFCIEYIRDHKPVTPVVCHPLRDWQADLFGKLRLSPDPREIIFVVDEAGNGGKSWFTDYCCEHLTAAAIILPGKKADMVYALATLGFEPKIVFVDAPRSKQGEYIQYDFLEELKNGRIFCSKYESHLLRFSVPHVVVMMNESPDMNKLSVDRYNVVEI